MIVVGVTGTRNESLSVRAAVTRTLDDLKLPARNSLLVHGHNPKGADAYANYWALSRGIHVAQIPALWDAYGNPAGSKRNTWVVHTLEAYTHVASRVILLAFPAASSVGTIDCLNKAAGKSFVVFRIDV